MSCAVLSVFNSWLLLALSYDIDRNLLKFLCSWRVPIIWKHCTHFPRCLYHFAIIENGQRLPNWTRSLQKVCRDITLCLLKRARNTISSMDSPPILVSILQMKKRTLLFPSSFCDKLPSLSFTSLYNQSHAVLLFRASISFKVLSSRYRLDHSWQ